MRTSNLSRFAVCIFAASVLLAGCGAAQSTLGVPVSQVGPAGGSASKYLSHVIVIIQENRSFENFFAGYPGADAPMYGCGAPEATERGDKVGSTSSECPSGDRRIKLHQVTFQKEPDLAHYFQSALIDWHDGKMDGFTHW